jgi:hypothetical protein
MHFERAFGLVIAACLLGSCSGLTVFDGPEHDHISVANRSDYNVSVAAGGQKLLVSLDTKSALGQRLAWAASFGTAEGPPPSEFDTAASDWLKFARPECKATNGQRAGFGSFQYDLICESPQAAK